MGNKSKLYKRIQFLDKKNFLLTNKDKFPLNVWKIAQSKYYQGKILWKL